MLNVFVNLGKIVLGSRKSTKN